MRPRLATAAVFALAAVSTATLSGCAADASGTAMEANLRAPATSSGQAAGSSAAPATTTPSASAPGAGEGSSAEQSTSGGPMASEPAQPVPSTSAIPTDSVGPLAQSKASGQAQDGTLKKPTSNQAGVPQDAPEAPDYMAGTSTSLECPGGDVTVSQDHAVVSLTQECDRLVVSGHGVVVHAGSVDRIVVTGDSVTVTASDIGSVEFRGTGGVVLYAGEQPSRVDEGQNNMLVPNSAMK